MRRLLTATFLLLLLLPAAHALAADNASDLLVDACRDEKVDGTYSQRTYKRALDELPADSDQYTACRDVIERARLAALRSRNSNQSPGTQSSTPATGSGNTGGGSAGAAPQQSQAPAPAPSRSRRSTRRKSQRAAKPHSSAKPTATTTQPAAEQPLLPTGPVGNVSAAPAPRPPPPPAGPVGNPPPPPPPPPAVLRRLPRGPRLFPPAGGLFHGFDPCPPPPDPLSSPPRRDRSRCRA